MVLHGKGVLAGCVLHGCSLVSFFNPIYLFSLFCLLFTYIFGLHKSELSGGGSPKLICLF